MIETRTHTADRMVDAASKARRPVVHMSVVAVVVSEPQRRFIFDCIESFLRTTADAPFDVRVTAIDNSPAAGIGGNLRDRFPAIEVVERRSRRGYAANHNEAVDGSTADYLLICNDDLVFHPGTVERGVAYLEQPQHAGVGMVAFQLLNPDGSIQPSTYSFPTVPRMLLAISGLREWLPFSGWTCTLAKLLRRGEGRSRFWAHDRTVPVETFGGAAMLVRATAAREVGLMDEVAMVGGEETEWHRRFWNAGWKIMFLADAPITHYESQTIRVTPGHEVESLKGALNYFSKHRGRAVVLAFCGAALPIVALRTVSASLRGKSEELAARRACLRVLTRGLRGAALERAAGASRSVTPAGHSG